MKKLAAIVIPAVLLVVAACHPIRKEQLMKPSPAVAKPPLNDPSKLTDEEWRQRLTPAQYRVCREGGTEPSGSGALLRESREGTYQCAACGQPLFTSKTKYDACGWPSFWDALPGAVSTRPDGGALEALCSKCGSHLGHLFDDGPPPTGKRY